jgi:hypothetical protein
VPSEQAIKLAAAYAEPLGKCLDRRSLLVERAVLDDKPYRALDRCPASDPGTGKWRGLGTAPQTRPKPRDFSSRGGRKKLNVSRPCWANGADRSTKAAELARSSLRGAQRESNLVGIASRSFILGPEAGPGVRK